VNFRSEASRGCGTSCGHKSASADENRGGEERTPTGANQMHCCFDRAPTCPSLARYCGGWTMATCDDGGGEEHVENGSRHVLVALIE
jgi:hypothetical protein